MGRHVRARFGPRVAVLHSALPDQERAREWWRVRRGDARIVVGTRSAVFAPLQNLGLILVDEEQETAYKQEDTPRYNGRDTAIYRARLENVVAVLGSATPSLESYQNARSGKYKLLELKDARRKSPHGKSNGRRSPRRFPHPSQKRPGQRSSAPRHRRSPRKRHASHGPHQSTRLFLVPPLPQLRRLPAMPKLQHRPHLSQKPPTPRVPLLRLRHARPQSLPEMRQGIFIFRRRRRRAHRRISPRTISESTHRPPRSRHRPHQAAIPKGPGRIRQRRNRCPGRHANGSQRPRFRARHAGRRRSRGPSIRPPRFPRRRKNLPTPDAGSRPRRPRPPHRRSPRRDLLSRTLRHRATPQNRTTSASSKKKPTSAACCTIPHTPRWPAS